MVSPARYRYSTFRVSAKAAQFQGSGRTLQARDKHIILQAHARMLRQKAQSPLPPLLLAERGFPYSDDNGGEEKGPSVPKEGTAEAWRESALQGED